MADGSVIIDIKGDSSAFQKTLGGLSSLAGGALKGVGTAVGAATAAVGGLAAAAIKVGSGFESSMSQVAATMGITTDEIANGSADFELLSQAAKDAGATTAFSASQAAEALNYLALPGLHRPGQGRGDGGGRSARCPKPCSGGRYGFSIRL